MKYIDLLKQLETYNNLTVINSFMDTWELKAIEYYKTLANRYLEIEEAYSKTLEGWNRKHGLNDTDREEVISKHDKAWKAY